ncbi:MAG: cytochrome b6-f complex subunit PetL [Calothrix sp. MO_167.B12]|nr:cytochrome b6-f complex subunit PetL [Calothrix sp. MO_167.B12]
MLGLVTYLIFLGSFIGIAVGLLFGLRAVKLL